jgi:putative ABC transport system ATP-binding protein
MMSATRTPAVPVMAGPREALRLAGVSKDYGSGGNGAATRVTALLDVSFAFPDGSFTAVMGPSGSGKSTLLQCAAGLDAPTSGRVFVGGAELLQGDETERARFRRERIGFVFQQYNLIPYLTVAQNVTLPLRFAGKKADRRARAELLARLGLAELAGRLPAELSGGQQQRVAIARALLARPAVLLADEPTGALDRASSRGVLDLLREAVDGYGQTVVMATHDPVAAARADVVIFLVDGEIADQLRHPSVAAAAERMARLEAAAGGMR